MSSTPTIALLLCCVLPTTLPCQQLLSPEALREKPLYLQLDRALEAPDKVYKLYLDKFQYEWGEARQLFPGLINLQSIIIVGEYFTELPEELLAFKMQLQEIVFQENAKLDLGRVCEQLQNFPYLRKLGFVQMYGFGYAPGTRMELPEELSKLSQVTELDLSLNPLPVVPAPVLAMRNLQALVMQSTELDSVPKQIDQLRQLRRLDLSCHPDARPNTLRRLPNTLSKLTELQVLNLNQLENLAELPPGLSKFKKLEELYMGNCTKIKLEDAVAAVSGLSALRRLSLMQLKAADKALPKDIGKLKALEWLNLYSCSIQTLPEELLRLSKLQYLNLRANKVPAADQKKWKERITGVEF